jgi:nicotinamidase-related amidase
MLKERCLYCLICFAGVLPVFSAGNVHKSLSVQVQMYDSVSGKTFSRQTALNPAQTAIIVVDMWNYHWCITASERASAMVPRMNAVLSAARRLGMTVVFNPSDVVTAYSGYPQYERAIAVELLKILDRRKDLSVKFTAQSGVCMCGPGLPCRENYGWDGMNPDLAIGENDLISSSSEEIYSLLAGHGVKNIIYMGVHTNICVFGKPGSISKMWKMGFNCLLASDLNDAFTHYDPATGYTPDAGTSETDGNLIKAGIPCIDMGKELLKANIPVDYVCFVPWGRPERPYLFEGTTVVTLTAPRIAGAEIRYTTDGSEPTAKSPLYVKPLKITQTQMLRTAAFRGRKCVGRLSDAYYAKLPDNIPPKPDVYLEDLEYIPNGYDTGASGAAKWLWYPEKRQSFEGNPLRIREKLYGHGMGFRAPSSVQYEIKLGYKRFVALAGVDDNILNKDNGRFRAMHGSVAFKLFIDGKPVAESPVMRVTQEPWRFDVEIPEGSRRINIACMDAGSRNILDYGNLTDAGFIVK